MRFAYRDWSISWRSLQAPEAPSRLERGFPPLKSNKQGAPLRGLHFSELREVSQEGTALNLHTIQGQKYPLELKQAWLPEGAVQALVEGLSAGARHKRLEAHRTWADLRSILRGEAHAARKRDMRMVAETGLKMHPSEDMLKDRGAARSRLLEVFEVERHQFGWGTCGWPTDGDLQWRWVGSDGKKHPQVDEKLGKDKVTKCKEPPCQLGGLYKAVGPWSIDVTEHTDAEGWVYGMAWSQPEWNKKPLMMDVLRRRRWTRPYS